MSDVPPALRRDARGRRARPRRAAPTTGRRPADRRRRAPAAALPGHGRRRSPSTSDPRRSSSLSPTATEMLFAIGAGPQVIAVDDQSNYPADAPKTDLSGFKPNAEAIAG